MTVGMETGTGMGMEPGRVGPPVLRPSTLLSASSPWRADLSGRERKQTGSPHGTRNTRSMQGYFDQLPWTWLMVNFRGHG